MPSAPDDFWHFSRTTEAQAILSLFQNETQQAAFLYGPKGVGKTEFIQTDLIPEAQKAGYLTTYVDLLDDWNNPVECILNSLTATVSSLDPLSNSNLNSNPSDELSLGPGSVVFKKIAQYSLIIKTAQLFTDYFSKVSANGNRLLITIDNSHLLARSNFIFVVYALRVAVSQDPSIRIFFTGNNKKLMFRFSAWSAQPFSNWATEVKLTPFGSEYLAAMVAKVRMLSKFPLTRKVSAAVFKELHKSQVAFQHFVLRYLTHAPLGATSALNYVRPLILKDCDDNYELEYEEFSPLKKAVLRAIAAGIPKLQGIASRKLINEFLELAEEAPLVNLNYILLELEKKGIIIRIANGVYVITDEGFEQWLRRQPGVIKNAEPPPLPKVTRTRLQTGRKKVGRPKLY